MAIRESVLAMYGEISRCLERLDEVPLVADRVGLRDLTLELTGLTGSSGERGWLGELFRYFDDHRTEQDLAERSDPVKPPDLSQAYLDLASEELTLAPSWASRTLAAAHVLDQFSRAGLVLPPPPQLPLTLPEDPPPPSEAPDSSEPPIVPPILLLTLAFAASPGIPEGAISGPPVRLGLEAGADLARKISAPGFGGVEGYWKALADLAPRLDSSVATLKPTQGLRKVKGEYCGVVTTTAKWEQISYTDLKRVIAPENWSKFFGEFFCRMEVLDPADDYGWTRILEVVSGNCKRYELRTGLRFWKSDLKTGIFINYDVDPVQDPRADPMVLVDNGYIWITPVDPANPQDGVHVRTSKELLINGMSATAMVKLAETMGVATNACDMFFKAAKYTGTDVSAWAPSPKGQSPSPDTSATWKTVVPRLPDSLRDEMCRDTTEFLQNRLTAANKFAMQFGGFWSDGVDGDELDKLMDEVGEEVTESSKLAFKLATDNFRPQPQQPPAPAEP